MASALLAKATAVRVESSVMVAEMTGSMGRRATSHTLSTPPLGHQPVARRELQAVEKWGGGIERYPVNLSDASMEAQREDQAHPITGAGAACREQHDVSRCYGSMNDQRCPTNLRPKLDGPVSAACHEHVGHKGVPGHAVHGTLHVRHWGC